MWKQVSISDSSRRVERVGKLTMRRPMEAQPRILSAQLPEPASRTCGVGKGRSVFSPYSLLHHHPRILFYIPRSDRPKITPPTPSHVAYPAMLPLRAVPDFLRPLGPQYQRLLNRRQPSFLAVFSISIGEPCLEFHPRSDRRP